ncbi:unnamed protein product [Ranitomeya imitator]|uniref:Protein NDNF n=1 Tax=Ranitomeya imitator TaxID=111125 RepID=A0ABN9MLS8_9NEOB|nr:unnamed protein product [Ranitomeya imitator]
MDDIVIFSLDCGSYLQEVQVVLDVLRKAGFTINPKKCTMVKKEARYLSYIIGRGKIKPQVNKVEASQNCLQPISKKQGHGVELWPHDFPKDLSDPDPSTSQPWWASQVDRSKKRAQTGEVSTWGIREWIGGYYFTLGENLSSHFSITVTPCDVPIEWSILHYKESHAFHGKTAAKYRPFDNSKNQAYYKTVSTLFNYKGNSVENYVGTFSYSSLFVLEFLSTERDTHISVYLTTDLAHGNLFPELPGDPRIDVTTLNHNSVSLVWKASPSAMKQKDHIEYCILVNEKHNYKSMCAADTAIRSAGRKWPKLASFPISKYLDENQRVMLLLNMLPTQALLQKHGSKPKPKDIPLKDGKIIQIKFDGKRPKPYTFEYQALHKKVHFTFQVCRGQLRAQISKNGKLLVSETIQGLRHITLHGKFMDKYLAVFKQGEPVANTSAMIQASSHMHKSLFPFFPNSVKIKSFNKLRTCNSITIAWLGTQERNMYCVYKRKLQDQVWREMASVDNCSGPESRPKSEKVLCKYFHEINVQKAVTTETIVGLERGTLYLFDVYLIGSSGLLVRYQSKVVKTRKTC